MNIKYLRIEIVVDEIPIGLSTVPWFIWGAPVADLIEHKIPGEFSFPSPVKSKDGIELIGLKIQPILREGPK